MPMDVSLKEKEKRNTTKYQFVGEYVNLELIQVNTVSPQHSKKLGTKAPQEKKKTQIFLLSFSLKLIL